MSAHSALGGRVGLKPEEVIAARDGVGSTERENALLAFARRVVRTGGACEHRPGSSARSGRQ
ncbi:MAG: hypothetical protein IPJ88_18915 [Myxococcales bacterium]|nr:MAG: hypothetical protein IPJ88_18915 [Myxococcales bacterium]